MTQQSDLDRRRMEAVEAFRLGKENQGSDALVKFMDCLASFLEDNSTLLGRDEEELLGEIIAAQHRGDYIFVADLLEYILPNTALGSVAE